MDWLEKYTFPTEASLADLSRAKTVYTHCVRRTLAHGTTTASYYATNNVSSTNLLADICLSLGQRAFVGRVCMDTALQPEWYRDASPESSLEASQRCIDHVKQIDPEHKLITPIITPRFAPSCTEAVQRGLGKLSLDTKMPVQTHISENKREIELVRKTFPEHGGYAQVYDAFGLLGPQTILAHAVHLTPNEVKLVKDRGAKVSHCPVSNTSIASGMAPVRDLLDAGIEVSLGTDVSGGYSPSVLVAVGAVKSGGRGASSGMGGGDDAAFGFEVMKSGGKGAASICGFACLGGLAGVVEVSGMSESFGPCTVSGSSLIGVEGS